VLEKLFDITGRGSTIQAEIRGGAATFFTMAYIVVLNPIILSGAADLSGAHLDFRAVATATALVACVMTILMGVVGNMPIALAAGLGLNGVVAFTLASQMSWADAMGVVVLEGNVITILVLTGLRRAVFDAVPLALKQAISVGIGLFIAIIGLVDAGFVRRTANPPVPLEMGVGGRLLGWPTVVFVVGLLLMTVLVAKKIRGGILIGIVGTTVFAMIVNWLVDVPAFPSSSGWQLNVPKLPSDLVASPNFDLLGHFSLFGSFQTIGVVSAVLFVYTLMLADFFDTMGTVVGVATEAGLTDEEGQVPNVDRVLLVDSVAALAGGMASASSNTSYIESMAGVADGARTGLASVVTGLLFAGAIFFTPLFEVVPYEAASPALVVVGFLMATQIRNIDWDDYELAIPCFLTMILMPFTYSITNGIGAGFISYVVLKLAGGKRGEIHPLLYVIAALFVVYFAIAPVESLLGVN
jgi:AGZA family xanthine/uracil permease-like MFS transporter